MSHRVPAFVALALCACHSAATPPPPSPPSARCKDSIELVDEKGRVECPAGTALHAQVKALPTGHAFMLVSCACPDEEEAPAPPATRLPSPPADGAQKL